MSYGRCRCAAIPNRRPGYGFVGGNPSWRDPRPHLAAVIVSIHIIGVAALGFRVSLPQILAAVLACALIEFAWALHKTGKLIWPASALLTGSGIALILRVVGTGSRDFWLWRGRYLFALVAVVALATKYLIGRDGSHVFNPSNVALVAVVLLLGQHPGRAARLLVGATRTVAGGGIRHHPDRRAAHHLAVGSVPDGGGFWLALAAGLGLLAASGHCITARWALFPVCGSEFWWIVMTSPELLIFLFFMITDAAILRETLPCDSTFVIRPAATGRWLMVSEIPRL